MAAASQSLAPQSGARRGASGNKRMRLVAEISLPDSKEIREHVYVHTLRRPAVSSHSPFEAH